MLHRRTIRIAVLGVTGVALAAGVAAFAAAAPKTCFGSARSPHMGVRLLCSRPNSSIGAFVGVP